MTDEKPIHPMRVWSPQRPAGECKPAMPSGPEFFDMLKEVDQMALEELGCRAWNDAEDVVDEDLCTFCGGKLFLFPGEWYGSIPDGFEVVFINGRREAFRKGVTDGDTRGGCLAYGILKGGRS